MAAAVSKGELFWRQVISQRENLKLTVEQACKKAGVSRASFYHWQKRFREVGWNPEACVEQASALVPVKIVDDRIAEITIELPGDIRVRVPSGCDQATLQIVIRTLLATAREQG
jgi:Winged helix-turn helix